MKNNIAEILNHCKHKTKLYSPLFGECYLDKNAPISISVTRADCYCEVLFDKYGALNKQGECILFPSRDYCSWKGVTTDKEGNLVIPSFNKFYCYGDAERCDDIRAEFKKLGVKNLNYYYFSDPSSLFYIDNLGRLNLAARYEDHEDELIAQGYKQLPYKYHPKDKELVWCWRSEYPASRSLEFYDEKNHCCFTPSGKRGGARYSYYEPFQGEYPGWAKEAFELLKD